ncbi:MAG: hypothetical protein M3Q86_14835 [Verrucomicrobiota bacterium]|nr:hypothetical protein [Verrucomicrobiota bacterium]
MLASPNFAGPDPAPRSLLRWCSLGLLVLFLMSVAWELNGSSVGMWSNLLSEKTAPEGLLFSSPKRVRGDEWTVWTPAMLSQAQQTPPFPIENPSLGAGRTPLIMSVPVAYYTTVFRPQLWGFFIFNFERGFSFYWCVKVFGLLFAVGWCLRQIGLRSPWLTIFGAIWIFFSSFTQWWFSSPAMLPEMIASWAICLGCAAQMLRPSTRWRTAAALAGFLFFAINFVLCLYPPYQIPLLLLGAAILFGVGRETERAPSRVVFSRLALGMLLVVLILIPFWFDVRPTLALVGQTVYPGSRRALGGDLSFFKLFSGLIGFFESEQVGPRIYHNIAEASNFYPLWPLPALVIAFVALRKRVRVEPLLVALGVILIALSLYCVVPWPSWLLHGTLLSFSTERRALLALGVANIFFCCLFLDRYRERILANSAAMSMGAASWLAMAGLLWSLSLRDPTFFADKFQLFLPLAINTAVIGLFFWESLRRFLPVVLGVLLVFSNAGINPLMSGLAPLVDSETFKTVERLHRADPEGKWIVFHSRYFAQLVKSTGAPIFNGTKVVPDLPFLHELDGGTANEFTYNRYANIVCELPREGGRDSVQGGLVHPDMYILFLPPDLPALKAAGYRYVVFPRQWPDARAYGFSLVEKIQRGDLWIYYPLRASSSPPSFEAQFPQRLARF